MVIDIAGIVIILLMLIRGYRKGFIVAVFSMLAVLLGVACSLRLAHTLSSWLMHKGLVTSTWALIVSYLGLFLVTIWLVRLAADALEKICKTVALGFVNRIAGGVLYAASTLIIWSAFLLLLDRSGVLHYSLTDESRSYAPLLRIAPWFFDGLGTFIPLIRDLFADIGSCFDTIGQKFSGDVGAD